MTILAMWTEPPGWDKSSFSGWTRENNTDYRNPDRSRASWRRMSSERATKTFAPQTEVWVHTFAARGGGSISQVSGDYFAVRDADDNVFFSIRGTGSNTTKVSVGAFFMSDVVDLFEGVGSAALDFFLKIDSTNGEFKAFVDGTEVFSFTGDTRGLFLGTAEKLTVDKNSSATNRTNHIYFTEMIIATTPTIGKVLWTREVTQGATHEWSGNISNVNGLEFPEQGNELTTDQANSLTRFAIQAIPQLNEGQVFAAVSLETSAAADNASGIGSIDYEIYDSAGGHGAVNIETTAGFKPHFAIWEADPRDNSDWDGVKLAEIELGMTSKDT